VTEERLSKEAAQYNLISFWNWVVCCCRQPYADNAEILDSSGVSGDFALFGIEQISIQQMFDFFLLRKSER